MIEQGPRLLGREDEDVSEAIRGMFDEDGITVLTDSEARSVSLANGRRVSLDLETPDGSLDLVATHLLVAVGRRPNSDLLSLEAIGLSTDEKGYIPVDVRASEWPSYP